MTIGLIYRGKDRDVIVIGNTLKEAESVFIKNKKEITHILKISAASAERTPIPKAIREKGSTADRILELKKRHFFDNPKTVKEVMEELKRMDFHYKPADLTDPLRRLVRKEELERTKELTGGTKSKKLMWVIPNAQTHER
jgi:hypothetical protein